jgi:hypothetical protein
MSRVDEGPDIKFISLKHEKNTEMIDIRANKHKGYKNSDAEREVNMKEQVVKQAGRSNMLVGMRARKETAG